MKTIDLAKDSIADAVKRGQDQFITHSAFPDVGYIKYPQPYSWMSHKQWLDSCWHFVKPEWRRFYDPRECPFRFDDVVIKSAIWRPSDLGQRFRVVGVYYSCSGNGWQIVLAYGEFASDILPDEHLTCSAMTLSLIRHD